MRPFLPFGKARQKASRGDCAGFAPADIGDIGEVAFEHILIFAPKRQPPAIIAGFFAARGQFGRQFVVAAQKPARLAPQRDDASAGQSRRIDNRGRAQTRGVSKSVGQNQPPFGVGVKNFDGLARQRLGDIAGLDCAAVGHIFASRNQADDIERQIGLRASGERAENRGRAAHIEFHFVHRPGGFERDAAGVESHAFADERERGAFAAAVVPQFDEARRAGAAFADRPQRAHADFFDFALVHHGGAQFEPPREAFGGFAQKRRIAIVAGQFGQMQSPAHAESERFGEAAGRFGGGVALDDGDNGLAANRIGRRIGEMKTMPGARASDGDNIRPIPGGERRFGGQRKNNRARRIVCMSGASGERGASGGIDSLPDFARRAAAQTGDDDFAEQGCAVARRSSRSNRSPLSRGENRAGFARKLAVGDGGGDDAAEGFIDFGGGGRKFDFVFFARRADDERIAFFGERFCGERDFHFSFLLGKKPILLFVEREIARGKSVCILLLEFASPHWSAETKPNKETEMKLTFLPIRAFAPILFLAAFLGFASPASADHCGDFSHEIAANWQFTNLHCAARANDATRVEELIHAGADVNARTTDEGTPLHIATPRNADDKVVALLIRAGADVNARNSYQLTPLHIAAEFNADKVAALLIRAGADVNARGYGHRGYNLSQTPLWTPLHNATARNADKVAALLIRAGADVNARGEDQLTPFHWAALRSSDKVVALLIRAEADVNVRDSYGKTPLDLAWDTVARLIRNPQEAIALANKIDPPAGASSNLPIVREAAFGNADSVRNLAKSGADVNAVDENGDTAVVVASANGHKEAVAALIEFGANINQSDGKGETAIAAAIRAQNSEMVKTLYEKGADLNQAVKSGETPLMLASQLGLGDIAQFLTQAGVDLNAKGLNGKTAMYIAVAAGALQLAQTLIKAGADAEAADDDGKSALDLLKESENEEAAKIAREAKKLKAERQAAEAARLEHEKQKAERQAQEAAIAAENPPNENDLVSSDSLPVGEPPQEGSESAISDPSPERGVSAAVAFAESLRAKKSESPADAPPEIALSAAALPADSPPEAALSADAPPEAVPQAANPAQAQIVVDVVCDLCDAVKLGDAEIVALLLQAGHDPNARDANGKTAIKMEKPLWIMLSYAIQSQRAQAQIDIVRMLTQGVDAPSPETPPQPEAPPPPDPAVLRAAEEDAALERARSADSLEGWLAFAEGEFGDGKYAAIAKSELREITEESFTRHRTALHFAADHNDIAQAEMLLRAGANPNAQTDRGFTPLMFAARKSNLEIVKMLLDYGANPKLRERNRKNALDYVRGENGYAIREMIKKWRPSQ